MKNLIKENQSTFQKFENFQLTATQQKALKGGDDVIKVDVIQQ